MKFQIKNRWTGKLQWECELDAEFAGKSYGLQLGAAVKLAHKRGADLRDAVLRRAVLGGAVLSGADLSGAVLGGADLRRAVLGGAVLSGADLSGADLRDAVLGGAVLSGADLSGADLSRAVLSGADLSDADLSRAVLGGAVLEHIRVDFFDVLLRASTNGEVPGLIAALKEGRVDGSTYQGECACLVGTIANVKGVNYDAIPDLQPNSARPIEQFFTAIQKDDTPETNSVSKIVLDWAEDFQRLMARSKEQVSA